MFCLCLEHVVEIYVTSLFMTILQKSGLEGITTTSLIVRAFASAGALVHLRVSKELFPICRVIIFLYFVSLISTRICFIIFSFYATNESSLQNYFSTANFQIIVENVLDRIINFNRYHNNPHHLNLR